MYSDEGVSVSFIEKRHGFSEVLSLATEGMVDIVYTNEQDLNKMHAKGFVSLEMYTSDLREIVTEIYAI